MTLSATLLLSLPFPIPSTLRYDTEVDNPVTPHIDRLRQLYEVGCVSHIPGPEFGSHYAHHLAYEYLKCSLYAVGSQLWMLGSLLHSGTTTCVYNRPSVRCMYCCTGFRHCGNPTKVLQCITHTFVRLIMTSSTHTTYGCTGTVYSWRDCTPLA